MEDWDEWRAHAPWVQDIQVEQDLIISRALVEIFSNPYIGDALAFRGSTALRHERCSDQLKKNTEREKFSAGVDRTQK